MNFNADSIVFFNITVKVTALLPKLLDITADVTALYKSFAQLEFCCFL